MVKRIPLSLVGLFVLCVGLQPGAMGQMSAAEEASLRAQERVEQGQSGAVLADIMAQLQRQQQMLDRMSDMLDRQRRENESMSSRLENQENTIAQLQQTVTSQQGQLASASSFIPSGTHADMAGMPNYGAEVMYNSAYAVYRTAIFDVRRRDAQPYFERAIVEFRKVVDTYPQSLSAQEAQYRIARIYQRFLNSSEDTARECRRYLELYPASQYAGEIREMLAEAGYSPVQ